MSNRERISANNASIQACIDKANALPNAAGAVEKKTNVTSEFPLNIYPGDSSMGTLNYAYCPPTSEGGTTFTMMEINSFGFVAAWKSSGLVPGDVYDVYCVPFVELWQTVLFANPDYSTLWMAATNENVGRYAQWFADEGRLRVTIPEGFNGHLCINVKWTGGGCAIYKVN